MGFTVWRSDELEWDAPSSGGDGRGIVRLSDALTAMRANAWRFPTGTRNSRHVERVQEELFVVLEGTATMWLGEPPQRVELPQGSFVSVEAGTALQVGNENGADAVVLIVGAPPETGGADYLPDAG